MYQYLKLACLSLLLVGLVGCSSLSTHPTTAEQKNLNALQHWQARGKLAAITPEDSATGYLTWEQNKRHYDVFIAGPFGARASRLAVAPKQASLQLPGWKQPQYAKSAEALMSQHLGWNFPAASLPFWIKGQVAPQGKSEAHYNEQGLLQSLKQHGWQIHYSRYQQHQGFWLPGLIKMQGYGYRFNLAISQWKLYDL